MKLTPAMKIILAVAAVCIAITLITTNNVATVMVLYNLNNNSGTVVQQAATPNANANNNNNNVSTGGSTDSTVTPDANAGTATTPDANAGTATTPDANANSQGSTGGDTAKPDANKPADNSGAASGQKTTKEAIDIFNKAANGVKTSAKSVKQKNVTNYLAGTPTITSGISFVYNNILGGDEWLDGMLKDNSQGEATYTGADIKAKFPIEGETWSSKLTADDVTKAECVENGGAYTITIVTKADAKSDNVKRGEGHAPKAFNVVLPNVVNDNIPSAATSLVGTASMDYPASTIVAKVDVKTGRLISAEYDSKWTINFDKMGIILPLGTKASYEINY